MAVFKVKCSCGELWLREIYAHDQLLCNLDGKTCNCTEWDEKESCYKIAVPKDCRKRNKNPLEQPSTTE